MTTGVGLYMSVIPITNRRSGLRNITVARQLRTSITALAGILRAYRLDDTLIQWTMAARLPMQ